MEHKKFATIYFITTNIKHFTSKFSNNNEDSFKKITERDNENVFIRIHSDRVKICKKKRFNKLLTGTNDEDSFTFIHLKSSSCN